MSSSSAESSGKFSITTPIYYVNASPHIGHAYTTVLADVLVRGHRALGQSAFFLTGTDEHGQKVYEAAKREGCTPLEHADKTHVRFKELWERLGIQYDDFIRTTEPRHTAVVAEILQDLYDRELIYAGDYEGWYSVSEERFYTEKDLVDGKSPEGKPVEKIVEKNYFFKMSAYQDWLIQYIEENPDFIRPEKRRNETLGYLKKPLGDLCISRPKTRLPWGIELPFDRDYVCYVWFDALVNYISAIGYRRDDEQFNRWWPASVQLLGKDILTTHTVYWPTMLRAMGVEMPKSFFAHGWWLIDGEKMAKSVGNVVDPMDTIALYGVDSLRYYLMAAMNPGSDATFTEGHFIERFNTDLANDLGNLTSRVSKMTKKSCGGVIPPRGDVGEEEALVEKAANEAIDAMRRAYERVELDRGIAAVLGLVRETNRYFDKKRPWELANSGDTAGIGTVMNIAADAVRIAGGLLDPVMPQKMAELRKTLGFGEKAPTFDELAWGRIEAGQKIGEAVSLFPRIVDEKKKDAKQGGKKDGKKSAKGEAKPAGPKNEAGEGLVDIESFFQTKLCTARVVEAEPVPKADKLLRLQVDVGSETRQLVAGIAEFYGPDELVGRTIVVVKNLKPAKIRGVESRGMLLATKGKDGPKLVTIDGDVEPGTPIG